MGQLTNVITTLYKKNSEYILRKTIRLSVKAMVPILFGQKETLQRLLVAHGDAGVVKKSKRALKFLAK